MSREIREIGRFHAVAQDGTVHTVIEYRHFAQRSATSGPSPWQEDCKQHFLATGSAVACIETDTFEVVHTGEILLRLTGGAPAP